MDPMLWIDPDAYTSRAGEVRLLGETADMVKCQATRDLLHACMQRLIETMSDTSGAKVTPFRVASSVKPL